MRLLGLIGGMSWESTLPYYRAINQGVAARLGGLHSARVLVYSVDFHEIEVLQRAGNWDQAGALLADAARSLHKGGAEGLLLCTNTMHKVAPAITQAVPLPLLHIADPTAQAIHRAGLRRVALLGTRFTMEQMFYRSRLEQNGLTVLTPSERDRGAVHRIIYEELCRGEIRDESRAVFQRVISDLVSEGAEGVILGCTEIGLLIAQGDVSVPVFDTAALHAEAAVEWMLG